MALIKCSECGKDISDKAHVCPNCGNPTNTTNQFVMPNISKATVQIKAKTSQVAKTIFALIIALITFFVFGKIIIFIVALVTVLGLSAIGIHISESEVVYANVDAIANIIGFIGGAILAIKIYKRITKKSSSL